MPPPPPPVVELEVVGVLEVEDELVELLEDEVVLVVDVVDVLVELAVLVVEVVDVVVVVGVLDHAKLATANMTGP